MKIGVDIRSLMDKNFSGVSTFTYNLLLNLLELDKENKYFLYYNSLSEVNLPTLPSEVEVIRTSYPNKIFNYIMQKGLNYPKLDKVMGGLDLFWEPHFNFFNLSKDVKNVVTVHDLSFIRYREFFSQRKNSWHKALNIKKILNDADKIMTVSKNTGLDIMELFSIPERKIEVIYSGLESGFFDEISNKEKERVRNKLGLAEKFILSLSTLEPRKNIVSLIEAYNILRRRRPDLRAVKLVIAGSKGWRYQNIINSWHKSEFKDDIIFLGYIEDEDKKALYSLAEVFVFPSFYEGFGFPILEAMAVKTPVICSFNSSLSEVAGSSALLINPFRVKEIAWSISQLIDNNNLKEFYIKRGYDRSLNFSWQKTAKSYLETFNSM